MRQAAWLVAALALVGIGATIWLTAGAPPSYAPVTPAAAPLQTETRLYLSGQQQAEARKSGTWLHPVESLLRVDRPMRYGQFIWRDRQATGPVWIRVDLRTQLMSVFRGGHEIGTAVVLYGADQKETPLGTFPILWKKRDHVSSLYDAPMPYTLRLTNDGVAIHGSDVRWGAATHGCVGVPKDFAAHLFEVADVGDQVIIVRTPRPAAA